MVDSNDVGKEGERLDLSTHEINENFLVEVLVLSLLWGRLQGDRVHDQWNEFSNFLMNKLFVELIHENDNDGQFLKNLGNSKSQ